MEQRSKVICQIPVELEPMVTDFIRSQVIDFIRNDYFSDSSLEVEVTFIEIKHSPYTVHEEALKKRRQACLEEIENCDIAKILKRNGFTIKTQPIKQTEEVLSS